MADAPDYSQFIRPGVPFGWTPPPSPTPGQVYAAYGDTGPMSGETEGLSPAMRAMLRRNLGKRLSDQTMAERQQTAEQAMRGAAYIAPNPLLAAGTAGLTSQFMGDTPQQTATQVASSLLPAAGGQAAGLGMRYAPRLTAGLLYGGALAAPDTTESVAADTNPNPFRWDEAAAAKRRKDAERTANDMGPRGRAKFLTDFQAREDAQRAETQKNAADWEAANSARNAAGDALARHKAALEPSARVLKPEVQDRIRNATSIEEASKIYNDAMSEHEAQSKTFAEKYPGIFGMEGLQIGSALLGGYGAYKTTSRRAAALENATKDAQKAYDARYGTNVAPTDIPALDNNLALKNAILRERAAIPSFSKTEIGLGMGTPWMAGVVIPNAIDAATSPNEDVKNRAMNNIIPGWNPGNGPGGRDFGPALMNLGRSAAEGLAASGAGSYAGKVRRDYDLASSDARAVLGAISGAKNPPATPVPTPAPTPSSPPSSPMVPSMPNTASLSPGRAYTGSTGRPFPGPIPQGPFSPADAYMPPGRPLPEPGPQTHADLEAQVREGARTIPGLSGAAAQAVYRKMLREDPANAALRTFSPQRPRESTTRPGARRTNTADDENGPPAPDEISRAALSPGMYNPPAREPRPFEADYPNGVAGDAVRVSRDIEGRPLSAPFVAGRRVVGGADEAIRPTDFDAITQAATGGPARVVPASELGRDFGRARIDPATGLPNLVRLRAGMSEADTQMVHAHEIGHVVDEIAGQISTKGLAAELKTVYNTLNNPNRKYGDPSEPANFGKPYTPEALKYKGEEVPREYIAEAIRSYMADPNYLKSVAPKTAAAIRAAVNPNSKLSKIIQFNTLGPLGMLGAAGVVSGSMSEEK